MKYNDATIQQIDEVMENSWKAFQPFKKSSFAARAAFMRAIADEIESLGDELITVAGEETNLPDARLRAERARTVYQLRSYADACERGDWLQVRIDTADNDRVPAKPDIRKTMVPLGPVIVFGASNFPFAYSTAGGDTACAFAAGCPVIVKAHPEHAGTSAMVAGAIKNAVTKSNLPEGVFHHVYGASFEVGHALVTHPRAKAVGFTGSFQGGKALFDWASQRKEPIPVFAEMGSINPVFLFPDKLKTDSHAVAKMYAASITLGVGQFCTNPGLMIMMESDAQQIWIEALADEIRKVAPGKMLHEGIAKAYNQKRKEALSQTGVDEIAVAEAQSGEEGVATVATASAEAFLNNPVLHQEVFGPYSLIIRCRNKSEMLQVLNKMDGQLTASVLATDTDLQLHQDVISGIQDICGRVIFNGMPTGVEVCLSMHHGGPFPATTDSRFTSVGADGIRRFARPLAYQNCPDTYLPPELQNANPLHIWRTINDQLTKDPL